MELFLGLVLSVGSDGTSNAVDPAARSREAEREAPLLTGSLLYIYYSDYTSTRLTNLGATVTRLYAPSAGVLTRDDLCPFDVVFVDIAAVRYLPSSAAGIQQYVTDGGGYVVVQPNSVGWVPTLPAGFEVYVSDVWWPGGGNSTELVYTAAAATHPITAGLPIGELSGNFDTTPRGNLGASWTELAYHGTSTTSVALLTGTYGNGRIVYNNHNFGPASGDGGTDNYLDRMTQWAMDAPGCPTFVGADESGGGSAFDARVVGVSGGRPTLLLSAPGAGEIGVSLYDAQGRAVRRLRFTVGAGERRETLGALSTGLYLFRVSSPWGAASGRFVVR